MKAAQINTYGGPEVVIINPDAAKPSLKEGQILVKVYAASLNPFDNTIRKGYAQQYVPLTFPATLGGDFSGVITEIAKDVTAFKAGDAVYGQAIIANGRSGSFAEYTAANVKNTGLKPKTIDHVQAASLPLVGSSALQALEEHIKLHKNQKILIHGGAGGIGSIAIQLAKLLGAYVATTVSTEGKMFVRALGADEIIDYQTQHFETFIKDYDAVFDTVGGEITNKSLSVLKKGLPAGMQGGILVTMTGQPDQTLAKQLGVTAMTQMTRSTAKKLNRLSELVDTGKIKPRVDRVFPFEKIKEAITYFEQGHPKGKVALTIKE